MSDYLTEQEQVQQIKAWVKQYGMTVVAGILIAVIASSGWRYYQNYRNKQLLRASATYDEMLTLRAQNNADKATEQAKKLVGHFPKSPYAQMAAFMLARDAIMKKDYPEAINQLKWVIAHSKNHAIQQIARIRIARILLSSQNADGALEILKNIDDKSFLGMIDEVRGDAYLAKNDPKSARQAYELALKELPNAEITRPLLEMKYDNLAGAQPASSPISQTKQG